MTNIYLVPFLKAFLISFSLSLLIIFFPWGKKIFSRNSSRHIHKKNIPRLGGAAIIIGFLVAILVDPNLIITTPLWGIIIASVFILIFGLWDDFWELDWRLQLFFQICAAVIIFIAGVQIDYITNPLGGIIDFNPESFFLLSLFIGIVWILLLMNSMNWLDGIDGLSGGISLIGTLTIFFLSLKPEVNQPPVGIITISLAGAILGFLILNFNPSMILAGTSGSIFLGFILSSVSIFAGTKIATALLVLSIPVIDAFFVIWKRFRTGESVFKPDKRHLHHKLLKIGWSQKKISLFFYTVTILIGIVALNTRAIGKLVTIILVFTIMVASFIFINKKIKKHED